MVKVKIPVNTPHDEEEGVEDGVGIMSDIDESDVDDDIGDPDWEEVKQADADGDQFSFKPSKTPKLSDKGFTITIERPRRKRRGQANKSGSDQDDGSDLEISTSKRKKVDVDELVRKSINRIKITEQLLRHKLSLLMYLARGLRLVKIINCSLIKGLSLSMIDHRFKTRARKTSDRKLLETFMEQFNEVVGITDDEDKKAKHMQQPFMLNLLSCFSDCEATSLIELVVVFTACLKAFRPSLPVRIINVLRPITLRANIIPKPDAKNAIGTKNNPIKIEPDLDCIVEKLDYWLEVYLADENKWCCVDLCNLRLDEPTVLTELSRPFSYLVSYDVDRHCVKPAEKNYVDNWFTPAFRRNRCEDKWWYQVMDSLGPTKKSDRDRADESKNDEILANQDMPSSDLGFRNHPLYVLGKHLLKFQGIYPPEVGPLGFFKDQPVYPRDCVHILKSRETWLRQARSVKSNEEPYKIVKARPKRDRYSGELIRDLPLELFGEWQTQEYDPPVAEDGKVPRNVYGNVDMYQECMLPKGCVWLKLPGLQRVANKLGIDCAAAVVGFDNHCGSYGAHPVIDGFIVCEEYADTLRLAWHEEQENAKKREEDKRQKRIWDNWKRLIKAAMIREKLRVKYKNS